MEPETPQKPYIGGPAVDGLTDRVWLQSSYKTGPHRLSRAALKFATIRGPARESQVLRKTCVCMRCLMLLVCLDNKPSYPLFVTLLSKRAVCHQARPVPIENILEVMVEGSASRRVQGLSGWG